MEGPRDNHAAAPNWPRSAITSLHQNQSCTVIAYPYRHDNMTVSKSSLTPSPPPPTSDPPHPHTPSGHRTLAATELESEEFVWRHHFVSSSPTPRDHQAHPLSPPPPPPSKTHCSHLLPYHPQFRLRLNKQTNKQKTTQDSVTGWRGGGGGSGRYIWSISESIINEK